MAQLFIALTGKNGSGKTTLAKKLAQNLPLNRVTSDDFIAFIKNTVPYFNDLDNSYKNEKYDLIAPIKAQLRAELSRVLLVSGQSVLHDSGGFKKQNRMSILNTAQQVAGVTTVLVWVDAAPGTVLSRLTERDAGGSSRWVQQNNDKGSFDVPTKDETDILLHYDQSNYQEIEDAIKELMARI